jgi:hypothetical protein
MLACHTCMSSIILSRKVGSAPWPLAIVLIYHYVYVILHWNFIRNSSFTLLGKVLASFMISSTGPYLWLLFKMCSAYASCGLLDLAYVMCSLCLIFILFICLHSVKLVTALAFQHICTNLVIFTLFLKILICMTLVNIYAMHFDISYIYIVI